jgi:hypothetical protein
MNLPQLTGDAESVVVREVTTATSPIKNQIQLAHHGKSRLTRQAILPGSTTLLQQGHLEYNGSQLTGRLAYAFQKRQPAWIFTDIGKQVFALDFR